ncbi:MAG: hypothetical protein HY078_12930 [Elusimicrobia bacterium]|nr:hypothetical protein [Elusimicrobiota bacterium]
MHARLLAVFALLLGAWLTRPPAIRAEGDGTPARDSSEEREKEDKSSCEDDQKCDKDSSLQRRDNVCDLDEPGCDQNDEGVELAFAATVNHRHRS